MQWFRQLSTRLVLVWIVGITSTTSAQNFPWGISSNQRYLQTPGGTPVFVSGEAGWAMFGQLTTGQAVTYLQDRANRGFNLVLASLPEPYYTDHAPNNILNVPPFTGAPFATPNNAYFAHADSMIQTANNLGIALLVDPLYIGFGCSPSAGTGIDGWCDEIKAASFADLRTFGTYMGNRYKGYANIVWIVGGDVNPALANLGPKIDTFVTALKAADNIYPNRLITGHGGSSTPVMSQQFGSWLTLNGIYTWDTTSISSIASSAYAVGKPFLGTEFNYENDQLHISPTMLRAQSYWAILGGACGSLFGNNPIWFFGATAGGGGNWQAALNSPGAQYTTYWAQLFRSRHWYSLKPDNGTVLTSGASSGSNRAVAAYAADSSSIIAYMPTSRAITINPTVLGGDSIRTQWFNPSTGVYTSIGTFVRASRSYTPPSAGDWVLVIDRVYTTAPSPPVLTTPANGATSVPVNPTLSWLNSAGATSYHVQVATNSLFSSIVSDQAGVGGTSLQIPGLSANAQYYWRVSATNAGGSSSYAGPRNFLTTSLCCVGARGNVNLQGATDLADLSVLVMYLTGGMVSLPCTESANINGLASVDLADLSALVSYLTGGGFTPPSCP
jgi:hypothetical protein